MTLNQNDLYQSMSVSSVEVFENPVLAPVPESVFFEQTTTPPIEINFTMPSNSSLVTPELNQNERQQPKKRKYIRRKPKKQKLERNFCCLICSETFNFIRAMRAHVMELHTSERQHECSVCMKRFIDYSKLDNHKGQHQGKPSARWRSLKVFSVQTMWLWCQIQDVYAIMASQITWT